MNDYDCEICYHPGEGIVISDALSLKERVKPHRVKALTMTIQSNIISQIRSYHLEALTEENVKEESLRGMEKQRKLKNDGTRGFKELVFDEAHKSS